jgi:hypothetical protein
MIWRLGDKIEDHSFSNSHLDSSMYLIPKLFSFLVIME